MPIQPQVGPVQAPQGVTLAASGQQSIDTSRERANITVGLTEWSRLAKLLEVDIDNPLSYLGVCDEGKGDFGLAFHGFDLWKNPYWFPDQPALRLTRQRVLAEICTIENPTEYNNEHLFHIHAAYKNYGHQLQHSTMVGAKTWSFMDDIDRAMAADNKMDPGDSQVMRTNRREPVFLPRSDVANRNLRQESDANAPIGLRYFHDPGRGVPQSVLAAAGRRGPPSAPPPGMRAPAPEAQVASGPNVPEGSPTRFMAGRVPPPPPGRAAHSMLARIPNERLPDATAHDGRPRSVEEMAREETAPYGQQPPRPPRVRRIVIQPNDPHSQHNVVEAGDTQDAVPMEAAEYAHPGGDEALRRAQALVDGVQSDLEGQGGAQAPPPVDSHPVAAASSPRAGDAPTEEDTQGPGAQAPSASAENVPVAPAQPDEGPGDAEAQVRTHGPVERTDEEPTGGGASTEDEPQEPVDEEDGGSSAGDDDEGGAEAEAPDDTPPPPPTKERMPLPPPVKGRTRRPSQAEAEKGLDQLEDHLGLPKERLPVDPNVLAERMRQAAMGHTGPGAMETVPEKKPAKRKGKREEPAEEE